MGVLYGVGVTFDQLFHLPQVSLLHFLKLLLAPANPGENENKPNDPVRPKIREVKFHINDPSPPTQSYSRR